MTLTLMAAARVDAQRVSAAESGRSSSYQLRIERACTNPDFIDASNAHRNDGFGFALPLRAAHLS